MFHFSFLNPFDITVYHAVNGLAGHYYLLDLMMIFFAKYALEIYAALFVISWFVLPKKDIQSRHALVVSGFAGILALLINVVISHIWFRPRPFAVLHKGTFTQLVPHSYDASFPSDHVAGGFGFAFASWGRTSKWISYSFTILAVIVMFARVYVGVHYPTDVIAGLLVGLIAGTIMKKLSRFIFAIYKDFFQIVLRRFNRSQS